MAEHPSAPKHKWPTRLGRFLKANGITSASVENKLRARLLDDAPSRRQFARWRHGRVEMRRKDMVRVLWAVREVKDDPLVRIDDLFDFDPDSPDIWQN